MNEEDENLDDIKPYAELREWFDKGPEFGGYVPRSFAEWLFEQIRLRDVKIAKLEGKKEGMNE